MKESNKKVWMSTTTKNKEVKTIAKGANRLLWLLVVAIAAIIVFVSQYFSIFQQSQALMSAFIIIGIVLILIVAKNTNQGAKGWMFLLAARLEMRKVVWPSRQETVNSTLIILAVVAVSSLIIYFVGVIFMHIIQAILS
ncbi:MAG: preprotein translocase subunit SecE [Francisellaceae bacterium]